MGGSGLGFLGGFSDTSPSAWGDTQFQAGVYCHFSSLFYSDIHSLNKYLHYVYSRPGTMLSIQYNGEQNKPGLSRAYVILSSEQTLEVIFLTSEIPCFYWSLPN